MVGFIVFFAVLSGIALMGIKGGEYLAAKAVTKYEGLGKHVGARRLASVLAPLVAFMAFAAMNVVLYPPQKEFNVSNVDWSTRDGGVLGTVADAVLVRLPGASVEPGFVYSTATLSGNEYVSVPGGYWVKGGVTTAAVAYGIALLVVGGFTAAFAVGLRGYKGWMAKAKALVATAEAAATATTADAATATPVQG